MILPMVLYGKPILRKKALPVTQFNEELRQLCDNMIETMEHYEGIGLAAPQIGESLRLFIVDISSVTDEAEENLSPLIVINPVLTPLSQTKDVAKEGCLSIPGLYADVKRYTSVQLDAVDINNKPFSIETSNLIARIIQHENDHLDGILFTDLVLAHDKKEVEAFLQDLRKL